MKRKGICLLLAMMLILGVVGSTALAKNRLQSVFSGGLSMWFIPGVGSITYLDADYERAFNTDFNFHGKASLGLESGVTIIRGLLGIKKYLSSTSPEGLWIGGYGSLDYWSIAIPRWDRWSDRWSGTFFGFGVEGGYRYFFTPNLSVEPFAQVGYYTAGVGFAFAFGANVGYSF